ncbi:LPS-assembly protein LptD [Phaeovulum sp.]|uniref:LPS-assembly protein LptD n=1 Tax=Phaeovulum sp. TaxID=2934796 RepID=UPI0039E4F9E1
MMALSASALLAPVFWGAAGLEAQTMTAPTDTTAKDSTAATLMADRVEIAPDDALIASGAVEVLYKGNRLTASRIRYDAKAEMLAIEGPIRLTEPGQLGSILIADQAELSRDLQDGILTGARLVLARELQLAATTVRREAGRYTYMNRVVASSCQICAESPTPLWEIRARRVTHDNLTRQLLFEGAQFRAMGVPLAYIPNLRMPDPTVERMRGFLRPTMRTTSSLGTGLKLPYFLPLGDSRDLTLTPYFSASRTRTLELRYRQAFSTGTMEWNGAISRDDIIPGDTRGYLFADVDLTLPHDYRLAVDLRLVSDRSYLLNYDVSEDDRLWSGVTLERVKTNKLVWARIGNTDTLRDGETNSTQPALAGDVNLVQVFHPAPTGGELVLDWQLHAHRRSSSDDVTGRDMARATLLADWRRNWLLPGGVLATGQAEAAVDFYSIWQDSNYPPTVFRVLPSAAVELRWPWVKTSGQAAHVIEPIAQVIWSRDSLKDVPNEDSTLLEFDEGNLFSMSRYPGADARERGLRANLGIGWTRHDVAGWSLGVMAGRVFRADDLGQFSEGSGLSGKRSDWLLASHLSTADGLTLSNRALFDDDFTFSRDELRLGYATGRYRVGAGYLWMDAAPAEARPDDTSELRLDTGWNWDNGWSGTFETRYDFNADRAATAAVGISYVNECVTVDLSLSRRFTSSTSVDPETDFGFSVQLAGFGASGGGTRRVCAR